MEFCSYDSTGLVPNTFQQVIDEVNVGIDQHEKHWLWTRMIAELASPWYFSSHVPVGMLSWVCIRKAFLCGENKLSYEEKGQLSNAAAIQVQDQISRDK